MTANEPSTDARELYRLVLSDLRRHWRPLLVTDLVYKLVAFALLTPLVGLALKAGILLSGEPVLADMEIVGFLLRPVGLAVLLLIAALSLALVALEQASLLALAAGAAAGRRVRAVQALRWAARRAFPVLRLAVQLVARCLLLAAPFLAALALVYFFLLREFDINYYLKERPSDFWIAAGLGGLLLLGLLRLLVPRVVDWFLALPILLFEGASPRKALAESAVRSAGSRATIVRALLLWAGGALLLSCLVPPLFLALGRLLVPYGRGNPVLVLALMLLLVLLWAAANLLVTWLNASSFALLLVRTYERHGGGQRELVASLAPGHELDIAARTGLTLPRLLAGLAAVALAAGVLGAVLLRGVRADDRVLVIAHRGAAAHAPENTMASVRTALEQRADFVEIDVQETADGELAIIHDSDFMKVAGVATKIWDATSDQLQAIDVGSWFAPGFAGERVPRLRDVLEAARGRAKVMIELKYYGHDVDLERRVVAQVEELGVAGEIVVMSLEYAALGKVRALRPGWTVGLLTAKAVGDLTELDADFLAVNAGIATRSFVRRAHAKGKQVYVWTVNDPVRMFQMLNLGVDGIITDRPDLARSVLERRRRLSSVERLLVGLAFFFGAGADDRPVADDAG